MKRKTRLEKSRKMIGFVVGIIYSDGFEWLARNTNGDLCSHDDNPKLFATRSIAESTAEKMNKRWPGKKTIVRVYWKEVWYPKSPV